MFTKALEAGLKTIVFTRARKITELITTWVLGESPHLRGRISSYRAGFLPEERREIEAKLFSGRMDGVISTSALEMGIDVGGLDLCLLVGYPGTIINTWQRGGRVGRAGRPSAIVLIAGNDALDQYFLRNPHDFFGRNCEEAVLDPLNTEVLKRHIPCAAAESSILPQEPWIASPEVQSVLEELDEAGVIYSGQDGSWHSTIRKPQREVDLRGIGSSYGIFLEDRKTLIGSSSGGRVFTECHEGAVYLHRTKQFIVTKLDLDRQNVIVKPASLKYYTRALSDKDTEILGAPIRFQEFPGFTAREGRLKVTEKVTAYEKRRTQGQDLIGVVELDLPPLHFETVGIWIEIPDKVKQAIQKAGLHFMGGIHALEHAAISMFPLFALCDRDDIGGISTPEHPQVCRAAIFIYDGHPGGVGLSHRAFEVIEELLEKTRLLVESCPCETGCPSCIHSPKCGSGNKPLDKKACLAVLEWLLDPAKMNAAEAGKEKSADVSAGTLKTGPKPHQNPAKKIGFESDTAVRGRAKGSLIFPDLARLPKVSAEHETAAIPLPPPIQGGSPETLSVEGSDFETRPFPSREGMGRTGILPVIHLDRRDAGPTAGGRGEGEGEYGLETEIPILSAAQSGSATSNFGPVSNRGGPQSMLTPPDELAVVQPGSAGEFPRRLSGTDGAEPAFPRAKKIVVFDLETQKLADEVGGWRNVSRMRLSLGVAFTAEQGFVTFTEDTVSELIKLLKEADLVVGFNQLRFDYEVLRAYTDENLRGLPNLDIHAAVETSLGFRLSLDHLARFTLGQNKSGIGTDAVKWFRQGRMDMLERYCRDDVAITRDLYLFGLGKGYLHYKSKRGGIGKVPVHWSEE